MKSKNDEFLTVKEVATLLGVSERTVRRWTSPAQAPGERLACYHIGRLVRVRRSALEEFLMRCAS
jgi:excisionase family DNA binding protein